MRLAEKNWLSFLPAKLSPLSSTQDQIRTTDLRLRKELDSLFRERDSEILGQALLAFGKRQELAGNVELANDVYAALIREAEGKERSDLRNQAEVHLNAISGQGASGGRVEFLLRQVPPRACDPLALTGLIVGSVVFGLSRAAFLSRLLGSPITSMFTRGIGARLLAGGGAFLLEVPTFWGMTKLLREAADPGRQTWDLATNLRELAGVGLTLGGLKLTGAVARGIVGWALGPTIRGGGVGQGSTLQGLFHQAGLFAGILLGHRLEVLSGLRPHQDGATTFIDSLAMLIQFNVAGHFTRSFLGDGIRRLESGFETRKKNFNARSKGEMETLNFAFGPGGRLEVSSGLLNAAVGTPNAKQSTAKPNIMMMSAKKGRESESSGSNHILEALKKEPDNMEMRKVYADWLLQQGESLRGELIQLQLSPQQTKGIKKRAEAIQREIIDFLQDQLEDPIKKFEFAGGFLRAIELDSPNEASILALLESEDAPFIRKLDVTTENTDALLPLFRSPAIRRLKELIINHGGFDGGDLGRRMAASPYLSNLILLTLSGYVVNDIEAEVLAKSPNLSNLRYLDLSANNISSMGVMDLAASSYLKNLTHLVVGYCKIDDPGVIALAESSHFSNLTHLHLNYNEWGADTQRISDNGVLALAKSRYLSNLTHLDLSNANIRENGARYLAESPNFSKLTFLSLRSDQKYYDVGNDIGDEGAQALADSPYLSNLTHLDLRHMDISEMGKQALIRSPYLKKLTFLGLGDQNDSKSDDDEPFSPQKFSKPRD